jgi:OOP family OmpA-OmpF porin
MMRRWMDRLRLLSAGAFALALASSRLAGAQEGFALDRYEPSERGSDWFANESLDLRGHARPSLGFVLDYAHQPLVAYDSDGNEAATVVQTQFFAHLGGAIVLWDRVRMGLNVPVLLLGAGDRVITPEGDFATNEGLALGDPRVGADVRIAGMYGSPFSLAIGTQVFIPAGGQDAYVSDGTVRLRPRLMAAGDVGPLTYAGQVGFHYRPHDATFAGTDLGSELTFSAAAGVRLLDRSLILGPELMGSTLLTDQHTPLELLFGGKYAFGPRADDFRIGAAAGPGLDQGLGTPEVRVLASFEWFPAIEATRDRDGDGFSDLDDRCPGRPAGVTADPSRPGCPAPDVDGDGFADHLDACPTVPGVAHTDPAKQGCPPEPPPPPPDSDGDGIIDAADACPNERGVHQQDPSKDGCPRVRLEKEIKQIRIIQRIEFEYDEAALTAGSHDVLEDVRAILAEHPEITLIEIQGHTDNVGGEGYNEKLSEARAQTVLQWLVDHGIEASRLRAIGYGKERPLDTNDTEEGRQQNRRVEFHILEQASEQTGESTESETAGEEGAPDSDVAPHEETTNEDDEADSSAGGE